jgi:hypothetical protein
MAKLADVLDREPFLHSVLNRPNSVDWEVRVPAVLRQYRDVATVDDYINRATEPVAPEEPVPVPLSSWPLDIPNAVGYLDAVWKARPGHTCS